jgi:hypothetical protein
MIFFPLNEIILIKKLLRLALIFIGFDDHPPPKLFRKDMRELTPGIPRSVGRSQSMRMIPPVWCKGKRLSDQKSRSVVRRMLSMRLARESNSSPSKWASLIPEKSPNQLRHFSAGLKGFMTRPTSLEMVIISYH